jgi:aconitate hydratase
LPLTFANPNDWDLIEQQDRISIKGLLGLGPGQPVQVVIHKADGKEITIQANHSLTEQQLAWFKAGSALNALN